MINKITICLTSCGRFDLLERTLKSLIQFWDGPKPKELLIYEDGPLISFPFRTIEDICKGFCPFDVFSDTAKAGQIISIDRLYSRVKTIYIFHCEDDWEFTRTGFIQPSMNILENNPDIMQVWLREPNDRNGHPAVGAIRKTPNGTKYQIMKSDYRKIWTGFSFNPGLRRLSDYKRLFPNGYSGATKWNPKEPWKNESEIGMIYQKAGMKAATLLKGNLIHIGNGRHIG